MEQSRRVSRRRTAQWVRDDTLRDASMREFSIAPGRALKLPATLLCLSFGCASWRQFSRFGVQILRQSLVPTRVDLERASGPRGSMCLQPRIRNKGGHIQRDRDDHGHCRAVLIRMGRFRSAGQSKHCTLDRIKKCHEEDQRLPPGLKARFCANMAAAVAHSRPVAKTYQIDIKSGNFFVILTMILIPAIRMRCQRRWYRKIDET